MKRIDFGIHKNGNKNDHHKSDLLSWGIAANFRLYLTWVVDGGDSALERRSLKCPMTALTTEGRRPSPFEHVFAWSDTLLDERKLIDLVMVMYLFLAVSSRACQHLSLRSLHLPIWFIHSLAHQVVKKNEVRSWTALVRITKKHLISTYCHMLMLRHIVSSILMSKSDAWTKFFHQMKILLRHMLVFHHFYLWLLIAQLRSVVRGLTVKSMRGIHHNSTLIPSLRGRMVSFESRQNRWRIRSHFDWPLETTRETDYCGRCWPV